MHCLSLANLFFDEAADVALAERSHGERRPRGLQRLRLRRRRARANRRPTSERAERLRAERSCAGHPWRLEISAELLPIKDTAGCVKISIIILYKLLVYDIL